MLFSVENENAVSKIADVMTGTWLEELHRQLQNIMIGSGGFEMSHSYVRYLQVFY